MTENPLTSAPERDDGALALSAHQFSVLEAYLRSRDVDLRELLQPYQATTPEEHERFVQELTAQVELAAFNPDTLPPN